MIAEGFEKKLHKLINGDKQIESRPLIVGRPSKILSECGANSDHNITITKKVIKKAMGQEVRDEKGRLIGGTGHGLSEDMIIKAIKELESPVMIFKGRHSCSLLVITNISDQKNRYVVIAIEIDRQEGFVKVNSIRSLYGRDNLEYFIGENIENGNLLAVNKEKADAMFHSIGKSYPKENTFISFN